MAVLAGLPNLLVCPDAPHELGGVKLQREAKVDDLLDRGTVVCASTATLSDAVDLMVTYDRTSAAVVDDDGKLVGVVTENDILRAYLKREPWPVLVGDWLESGFARLPSDLLPSEAVSPDTTLVQAAAIMRAHSASDHSCHHLLIHGHDGRVHGILSSLDFARAFCRADCWCQALGGIRHTLVESVMKPKSALPACGLDATLGEVLGTMDAAHQNCVLITDGRVDDPKPLGVITPRDALRAYSENVPLDVNVGQWLRGLQPEWGFRAVNVGTTLAEAASRMALKSVHHVLVYRPETSEFAGVLSTSDLAQAIASEGSRSDQC